ncbi:MAG: PKD domain-containing protein [Bacteroidales bacterium]
MGNRHRFVLLLLIMGLLLSVGGSQQAVAQTDTEFWFVAPTVTKDHGWPGRKFSLRFASMSLQTDIIVSMPDNPAFAPITITLDPNSAESIDLTDFIEDIWNFPVDQVNNRGILITSTNLITCYYEIGTYWNTDIFSLKGRNALGTDFYVPFQNHFANGNYVDQPYSKIDIVATQNNTSVTFTPSRFAHPDKPQGLPFTIVLNKGQTYSLAPGDILSGPYPREGQLPENRLAGTRVQADKPIAITSSDDSVDAGPYDTCRDIIGDQIVPVSVIGTEYIAMRGRIDQGRDNNTPELFYVTATQNNTVVFIDGVQETVIGEGQTFSYEINKQTHHIQTSSPSYVFHVAGFGCEMGGAILPPVNVCTGSTQVSFTRSKGEEFFLNILVRKGAEDGFVLNGDITAVPAAAFQAVEGTDTWLAAELSFNESEIPVAQASLIENTKDVFHLGIINGGNWTGTMYGYFSDFNPHQVKAAIVESGTDFEAFCYGQPIQLVAHGGVNHAWTPADYLDDPFSRTPIALPDKSMQYVVTSRGACGMTESASVTIQVAEPLHAMFSVEEAVGCSPFEVTITDESFGVEFYSWDFDNNEEPLSTDAGQFTHTYVNNTDQVQTYVITLEGRNNIYCVDEVSTTITVYPEVKTDATADVLEGCAPLTVSFSGNSQHATRLDWDFGDEGSSPEEDTVHTFHNYTSNDIIYEVVFTAENEWGCAVSDTLEVTVKPFIQAGFEFDPAAHCNPHELQIFNTAVGAGTYDWDFDDDKDVQHFDDESFSYPFENPSAESWTFDITQTVTNASGCIDTLTQPFEVYPFLEAKFEPSATEDCSPLDVDFKNLSEGAESYSWNFGLNQGSSSEHSPAMTFVNTTAEPQVHEVVLEVTSAEGCTDEYIQQITVNPELKADFSFENRDACLPRDFVFKDLSTGAGTLTWDFGDGSPLQQGAPGEITHTFPPSVDGPVTYQVSLTAENDYGCIVKKVREVTVYPDIEALASMDTSGCHPLEVAFTNQSKGAVKYLWTFGDGSTASEENPVHTFVNTSHLDDEVYMVTLIAESPSGCLSEKQFPITVHAKPKAAFEMPADAGCAPFEASLINASEGQVQSLWDPGDGSAESNTPDLNHEYLNQEAGVMEYRPVLYVTTENGCADTISQTVTVYPFVRAQVSLSVTEGCHPLAVEITNETTGADATLPYKWIYGDGETSVVETETHGHEFTNPGHEVTENYILQLTAYSSYGCEDYVQVDVAVHPRPEALFTSPAEPSCSPFEVAFDDQSLGTSLSYSWDFGDDSQSLEQGSTSHEFIQPPDAGLGWFTTSLRVENEFGCEDTHTREVGVYPLVTADFTEQQGCHPLTAQLDNLSQGAVEFSWDFADGNRSPATTPEHTFRNSSADQAEVYQVSLTAMNEFECAAEAVREITVYPMPQAEFSMSDLQGCSPLDVTVFNLSEGAETSRWIIGTEEFENGQNEFNHVFENLDEMPVDITMTLEASNQWQCKKTFSQSVEVYPEVTARFSSDQQMEGCTPLELPFINESIRADQYEWTFDDGTRSTEKNPAHLFFSYEQQSRDYEVSLKATSSFGCSDEFALPVRVHPRPVADFSPSPVVQTYPSATIEITNLSMPGQWQYIWDMGDDNTLVQDENPGAFSHTYLWDDDNFAARQYTIGLTVENPWCRDTTTREVVIMAPEPVPALAAPERGCSPFEVQFENLSQYGLSFLWDFGDGSESSEKSPRHTFTQPGHYRVKLLVNGHTDAQSVFHDITVHQLPVADFRVMDAPPNASHISIQTVNLSSLANTSHWEFGDGNVSFEHSPSHLYRNAGTYDITLTVGTDTDPVCYDTLVKSAEIDDPCAIHFPNAFVPATTGPGDGHYVTGDPLNQVFYPVFKGIEEYKLEIYNRWGELIFRSEELEKGWDGYYQGNLSKMDVYVWKLWARCFNGEEIRQAGDVTLYR